MGKRNDLYQQVTDSILESLKEGTAPWVKPWTAGAGDPTMPANAHTGRPYSGVNVLLLWAAALKKGYDHARWLTYKQAQAMGANVRKGEKSTRIVFAKQVRRKPKEEQEEGQDQTPLGSFYVLRFYNVFNVAQVDGLNIEPVEVREPTEPETLLARSGASIRYGGDRAAYSPTHDFIVLPRLESFKSEDDFTAAGFHELAHWTGHSSRLDREGISNFEGKGSTSYAEEELIAELGAAFLCATYGVTGKLQHAEYIGHWIKHLEDDNKAIFRASRKATDAAEYIRRCIDAHEKEVVAA